MGYVADFLNNVPLPKMVRVAQRFEDGRLEDVAAAVRHEIRRPEIAGRVKPGMRIALAVGSRGLESLALVTRTLVEELRTLGAEPFVVPGMGSHGGATAEGQQGVLASLGVTEQSVGCPILSSMATVELGKLPNGLPVLMDANAMAADGIVPVNRVKPHTSFSGEIESGLVKMLSIGLGKQKGADSCHALGFGKMAEHVMEMAKIKIATAPVLFGLATIENAFDKICLIRALPAETLIEDEKKLLPIAREKMPAILFNPLDLLIVDMMGKEFSGTGTDPNITGRAATPYVNLRQKTGKMVILDCSDATKGNVAGVGLADITTRRLFGKMDFEATYINHLTSTVLSHAKIPVLMDSDRMAIQAALKTCNVPDPAAIRLVRVKNTLQIGEIRISESLLPEALRHPQVDIVNESEAWPFDAAGDLTDRGRW
jgi:hypothetical protein